MIELVSKRISHLLWLRFKQSQEHESVSPTMIPWSLSQTTYHQLKRQEQHAQEKIHLIDKNNSLENANYNVDYLLHGIFSFYLFCQRYSCKETQHYLLKRNIKIKKVKLGERCQKQLPPLQLSLYLQMDQNNTC